MKLETLFKMASIQPKKYALLSILMAGAIHASPVYYTFNGTVTDVGVATDTHVTVGDTAEYQFMVDRDLQGYYTDNGNQITIPSPDFYYSKYLGGGPYVTLSTDNERTNNWGCDCSNSVQITGSVTTPNTWSFINVTSTTDAEWEVGDHYTGNLFATGANSDFRQIYSDLTLTRISDEPESVPEPNSSVLAGIGILALLFVFRTKRVIA